MADLNILKDKCVGCGICESACPIGVVTLGEDSVPVIGAECNLCGTCVEECPQQAIVKAGVNRDIASLNLEHLNQCENVWVFAETRGKELAGSTRELLGEARRLTKGKPHKVAAVLICGSAGIWPKELICAGADIVYVIAGEAYKYFRDEPYKDALGRLVEEEKPLAILFAATAVGRALAPRVAAKLKTGLSADCTELELKDNGLFIQTRPAFGGNLYASILCPGTWPQMATVRPKVMKAIEPDETRRGQVIEKQYEVEEEKLGTRVLEVIEQINEYSVDDAEIVVTAGYGAADERGLLLVQELAKSLNAAFGCSRKVVDAGLVSYEHQVGQTGKTVGPKLYIACGVSGAIQHIVGISSSKKIIAINNDPDAPIFQMADVGIVGDLYEIIPKLIEMQKEKGELSDDKYGK